MADKYLLSVITPLGPKRSKNIPQLLRDMHNQLLSKDLWEHIIVLDGFDEENWDFLVELEKNKTYNWRWYNTICHDPCEHVRAPGTGARNHATINALGTYVVYADDDDRYRDDYLSTLATGLTGDIVNCVQMTATDHQMYRGSKLHSILVPEVGRIEFPTHCRFGTPCMIYKRKWALERPWPNSPDHDYLFCRSIMDRFHPKVVLHPGMRVDVRGQVIGSLKDWVTIPPFHRGD